MKCEKSVNVNTTNEIKKNEIGIGCSITGKRKKRQKPDENSSWYRQCPSCNDKIYYVRERALIYAKKRNGLCRSCSVPKIPETEVNESGLFVRKCPQCKKTITYKKYCTFWFYHKKNGLCGTCATYKRLEKYGTGKGRKFSEKGLKNIRKAWNKRGIIPGYNPTGCEYMDSLKPIYNFQHAQNGGEVKIGTFSVDGYDKEKNIVFEYDEPRHFDKHSWTLKEKDILRMNEIKKELGCKFLRYDEKNKVLKEY